MSTDITKTKSPPLFHLDFGQNGGIFAPHDSAEAITLLQTELAIWAWLNPHNRGAHEDGFREAMSLLNRAVAHVSQLDQHNQSNPSHYAQLIANVVSYLNDVFVVRQLPHSSTVTSKLIQKYFNDYGAERASFFAAAYFPPSHGNGFQPSNIAGWKGLNDAIREQSDLGYLKTSKLNAMEFAVEELRSKTDSFVGTKTLVIEGMQAQASEEVQKIQKIADSQKQDFSSMTAANAAKFEEMLVTHTSTVEGIQKTFIEELALRAPAEYWTSKQKFHFRFSVVAGLVSFGAIALCIGNVTSMTEQALLSVKSIGSPQDSLRLGSLFVTIVFAVWAIRMCVRIFFSQLHLMTDASERIVMVKTYLSLIEGKAVISEEDRKVILQALFRPTSDGIVKDDGLPNPLLEALTRPSKS
jgi:hypothetical protein